MLGNVLTLRVCCVRAVCRLLRAAACCFTLDMTISAAFRRSLSQMAILEWPPFAATMADCLEPRGGWVEGNSGAGLPLSR